MQLTNFVSTLYDGKSNPNKVTVAFTMGVNALKKGHSATIILMVEAVELGIPGATEGMDIGAPFEPVSKLLNEFRKLGGQVAICGSCLIHNGFTKEQMDPEFGIITAPDVIDFVMNAKGTLPIA